MVHQVVEIDAVETCRPSPAGDLAIDVVEPERQMRQSDAGDEPRAMHRSSIASVAASARRQCHERHLMRREAEPDGQPGPVNRRRPRDPSRQPVADLAVPLFLDASPAARQRRIRLTEMGHRRSLRPGESAPSGVDRVAADHTVGVGDLLVIEGRSFASQGARSRPRVGSNSTAVSGTGGQSRRCVKPARSRWSTTAPGRLAAPSQARPSSVGQLHRVRPREVIAAMVLADDLRRSGR